jgi:hypothetical protein
MSDGSAGAAAGMSVLTEALVAGVPLQDVQDAAGHADPRTTRRYDRSRHNLDRHPTYVLARPTCVRTARSGHDGAGSPVGLTSFAAGDSFLTDRPGPDAGSGPGAGGSGRADLHGWRPADR